MNRAKIHTFFLLLLIITLCLCFTSACSENKNSEEFVDDEFISSIAESVSYRMNDNGDAFADLVNRELALLSKFEDASFKDESLKAIADKYLEGLNLQKESLKVDTIADRNIMWQRGTVTRYEALDQLYKEYNFMSDNSEFVSKYILALDDSRELLSAYEAIEADLDAQTITYNQSSDGHTISFTLKNNTKYTYSAAFEFKVIDASNNIFDSGSSVITGIAPDNGYTVSFYIDFTQSTSDDFSFTWEGYSYDIMF